MKSDVIFINSIRQQMLIYPKRFPEPSFYFVPVNCVLKKFFGGNEPEFSTRFGIRIDSVATEYSGLFYYR